MTMASCEVWVTVDETGNSASGESQEQAEERYEEEVGDLGHVPYRTVQLCINVPIPSLMTIDVDVPAVQEGKATVKAR